MDEAPKWSPCLVLATGTFDGDQISVEAMDLDEQLEYSAHTIVTCPNFINPETWKSSCQQGPLRHGFWLALDRFEEKVHWATRTGHPIAEHIGNDAPGFLPDEAAILVALNMELLMLYNLCPIDEHSNEVAVLGSLATARLVLQAQAKAQTFRQREQAVQAVIDMHRRAL